MHTTGYYSAIKSELSSHENTWKNLKHQLLSGAQGEEKREKYKHPNVEFQRIARRDKKAIFSDQCKEIEENNRMGRLEISSRKLEIPRERFMQRWA